MKLREKFKRKMPATFNAAEYETERILSCICELEKKNKELFCAQEEQNAQFQKDLLARVDKLECLADVIKKANADLESRLAASAQEQIEKIKEEIADKAERLAADVKEQIQKVGKETAKVVHGRMDRLESIGLRNTARVQLSFDVALAEHCNLKCAGCDHFSSLAEPEFADIGEFTCDFERLSELFGERAQEIHLLGGEPLLNQDIDDFMVVARKNFPNATIDITTNGLLLTKMDEKFWKSCRQNRIVIRPTKYPVNIDYEKAELIAKDYGVEYRYFDNTNKVVKTLNKYPLDLNGLQDSRRSFMLCHRSNRCIYLQHGRLYTCAVAATARHLKKRFQIEGGGIKESPDDSIDIYEARSAEEILNFLAHPIPFCRYCAIEKVQRELEWRPSEEKLSEWTL